MVDGAGPAGEDGWPSPDYRVPPPGTFRRMDVAVGPTLLFYAMGIVVVAVVVISAVWLGRGR